MNNSRIYQALQSVAKERDLTVVGKNRVKLRCPNPDHAGGNERTPAYHVWTDGPRAGQGKCYVCGFTSTWAETVIALGLSRNARFISINQPTPEFDDAELATMLSPRKRERGGDIPWPRDRDWRGINGELVRDVGGVLVPSRKGPAALQLPVTIREVRVGHVDCTLHKSDDDLSYVNSSGAWSLHALYPYDYVRAHSPRVIGIVEGARDALMNVQNGLFSLATLGSQNWTSRCVRLIERLGVETVVVMADPDDAGEKLRRRAYTDLRDRVDTRCIVLPHHHEIVGGVRVMKKDVDPADLDRRQLRCALERVGVVKDNRGDWIPTHRRLT